MPKCVWPRAREDRRTSRSRPSLPLRPPPPLGGYWPACQRSVVTQSTPSVVGAGGACPTITYASLTELGKPTRHGNGTHVNVSCRPPGWSLTRAGSRRCRDPLQYGRCTGTTHLDQESRTIHSILPRCRAGRTARADTSRDARTPWPACWSAAHSGRQAAERTVLGLDAEAGWLGSAWLGLPRLS